MKKRFKINARDFMLELNIKRLFDIGVSLALLFVLSPLIFFIAIVVRYKMGKPILFVQERPGFKGEIFKFYKFRTMKNSVDENKVLLPPEQRVTKFGKTLRKLSLDELPSLVNVLKGDISLVGPRPLLVEYLPLYNKDQARRHDVKPGITGWAQVNGRNNISWEEKFKLDLFYVDNKSFWLDLKILLLTAIKVFRCKDVKPQDSEIMPKFKGAQSEN